MKNKMINYNILKRYLKRQIFHIKKNINYSDYSKENKKIVFIIGYQRSGTTLLLNIFDKDLRSKIFPEFSKLSNKDKNKIRLNPLYDVKNIIEKQKANLIVIKPLVETQNILNLINYFKNSYAIFLFRNYLDVANSNLNKFGIKNGIKNLNPIIENQSNNWRSERVSEKTKNIIDKYYDENMSPFDAAALFWYVRNILFYELNLAVNKRILLCNYEYMVNNPKIVIKNIYKFIGYNYPRNNLVNKIFNSSVGKTLLESMSSGLFCITSRIPNLERIVKPANCGISLSFDNTQQAAEEIANFLKMNEITNFRPNARRYIEKNHDWDIVSELYLEEFNKITMK